MRKLNPLWIGLGFLLGIPAGLFMRDPPEPKHEERVVAKRCPEGSTWMVDRSGKPSCLKDSR